MSERENLFSIYRAIDRDVQEHPEHAEIVARYLGTYRAEEVGWVDQFEKWTREVAGDDFEFPSLEEAVNNLANEPPPTGRDAMRRLLAVAIASRLPDVAESVELHHFLADERIAGDADRAASLVELLANDDLFGSLGQWPELINAAVERGFLSADLAVHANAPPCSGSPVEVQPGSPHPAARLQTSFTVPGLTFAQATRFLDPSLWPRCCSFWCRMDKIAKSARGGDIYHEIVSLDCADPAGTFTAATYLEFVLNSQADFASVEYDLAPGRTTPSDLILVDNGSLSVLDAGAGGIKVDTVKVIKFNHPFSGEILAKIMCVLGYASAAEDLVFNCAFEKKDEDGVGVEFGTNEPRRRGKAERSRQPPPQQKQQRPPDPAFGDALTDAVDAFKRCAEDYACAYNTACDKIDAGEYTVDDYVSGVAGMWSRYMRDAAAMADLAVRLTLAAGASAATRARSEPAASGGGAAETTTGTTASRT